MSKQEKAVPVENCIYWLKSLLLSDRWLMGPSTTVLLENILYHLLNYQTMINERKQQANSSKKC